MIHATDARKLAADVTRNRQSIVLGQLVGEVSNHIKQFAENGHMSCPYKFPANTSAAVRNLLIQVLRETSGYTVSQIEDEREAHPREDEILISWR